MNKRVLQSFGLRDGVSHTEFICAHENGMFYFLETSARVGGAHIADLVEQGTGVNLWAEWARVEVASAQSVSQSYIEKFKDNAIRIMHETGVPASIILGVAMHESGSGKSAIAKNLNNQFGVKGGGGAVYGVADTAGLRADAPCGLVAATS